MERPYLGWISVGQRSTVGAKGLVVQLTARVAAACAAAFVALLFLSVSSAAAPKRISGELSRPGYTVIALADTGEAKVVRATPEFKLRPPAKRVSLHLQGRDGVYAGPIVVGQAKNGQRAIVGVKRGAQLGEVVVKSRKGFAKAKAVDSNKVDAKREARAQKGVPIGAGNFGLVRSRSLRPAPPGDRDADGIADPLDIDVDGNGVLDRYEGRTLATTAAEFTDIYALVLEVNGDLVQVRFCGSTDEGTVRWPQNGPEPIVGQAYIGDGDLGPDAIIGSNIRGPLGDECPASASLPTITPTLGLTLRETVNANAPTTLATLEQTFVQRARLLIFGSEEVKVELDCGGVPTEGDPNGWSGGLRYCRRGGTGRANNNLLPNTPPSSWPFEFPACCDGDGNGFGDIRPLLNDPNDFHAGQFAPGVTTAEIGTGDILTWLVHEGGEVTALPRALPDVFATVPALIAYDDDGPAGNPAIPVSYPVPAPYVGSPPAPEESPNSSHVGFPVAPCPQDALPPCVPGDVVVTFTFWRPQREAIGTEPGPWTEVGGLLYAPSVGGLGFPPTPNCMQTALSEEDPLLTIAKSVAAYGPGFGFRDAAGDRQANPQNTLTFSINMTDCFAGTWGQGERATVALVASLLNVDTAGYSATQNLLFTRE